MVNINDIPIPHAAKISGSDKLELPKLRSIDLPEIQIPDLPDLPDIEFKLPSLHNLSLDLG